ILLDVVELTRPSWQSQAKARGIAIAVEKELEAHSFVAGNASELREVFTNLVLNAVDAMPDGGVLTLVTRDDDDLAAVEVRASGHGMAAETQARCFDPFFTTKSVKGTGLGLSVAYGIVNRHHGTISVESAPCAGTTCRLTFPVKRVTTPPAPKAGEPAVIGSFRMMV